jgi:hypothetical protein
MSDTFLLSWLDALSEQEEGIQREILILRDYYKGEHAVELTDRLQQFIGDEKRDSFPFRVNLVKNVISAVSERLRVKGFDCADDDQANWADEIWKKNKMDALQEDIHDWTLRDGEAFVIVSFDEDEEIPELIPHYRWTDTQVGGDGYGCRIFYPDDNPSRKPRYAVKQWYEMVGTGTNIRQRERRTIYFPNRIERYVRDTSIDWEPYTDDEFGPIIDWTDSAGKPMGVAVIHFKNKGTRSEIIDAIPMQDATNKSVVDLLTTADMTAFRIYYALGFIPTDDGQEPAEDGSNWLTIEPGKLVGTTKVRSEVEFGSIDPSDLEPILRMCHQFMLWTAMVSDTPIARFITTGQIARKETLKEQEGPLLAKITSRQTNFGNSWEDVMELARKVHNKYDNANLDEEVLFEALWDDAETRSQLQRVDLMRGKKELEVPLPQIWRELGYTQQQINEFIAELETVEEESDEDDVDDMA